MKPTLLGGLKVFFFSQRAEILFFKLILQLQCFVKHCLYQVHFYKADGFL
jgi:hypothetical protein